MTHRLHSRRSFLSTSSGLAGFLTLGAGSRASAAPLSEVEAETRRVVEDYLRASTDLTSNRLGDFLAEDITYEYGDTRFDDRASMLAARASLMDLLTARRYDIRRSMVLGHVLLHERIDTLEANGGELSFHVASLFIVTEGRIQEWREYLWPDVE